MPTWHDYFPEYDIWKAGDPWIVEMVKCDDLIADLMDDVETVMRVEYDLHRYQCSILDRWILL